MERQYSEGHTVNAALLQSGIRYGERQQPKPEPHPAHSNVAATDTARTSAFSVTVPILLDPTRCASRAKHPSLEHS
jgi:hypothetical protein